MLILHYTSLMTACALIDIRRDDNDLDAPLTFNHEDPYLFRAKLDSRHIDSDYQEQSPAPSRVSCIDDPSADISLGLSAEQRAELDRLGGDSPANIRSCAAAPRTFHAARYVCRRRRRCCRRCATADVASPILTFPRRAYTVAAAFAPCRLRAGRSVTRQTRREGSKPALLSSPSARQARFQLG